MFHVAGEMLDFGSNSRNARVSTATTDPKDQRTADFCLPRVKLSFRTLPTIQRALKRFVSNMPTSPKAVLVDLSGTLHVEDEITPDAANALKRLRESFKVRFVSNTTKECRAALLARLQKLGFEIGKDEMVTSLSAARALLEKLGRRPMLFLEPAALEDFDGIDTSNPDCVVVGLAPSLFHYEKLTEAMRCLLKTKGPLIAIHRGRYFARKDGLAAGPGPFVAALEYACDCKAEVVGKPSKVFFYGVAEDLGVDPSECVMIGDDVRDDIGGARDAGMKGYLVKTGKYREGDETRYAGIRPDGTFESFAAAVDSLLEEAKRDAI